MSDFATAISLKSRLKKGVSAHILRFFGRFTALPGETPKQKHLQIYFQTHVILLNFGQFFQGYTFRPAGVCLVGGWRFYKHFAPLGLSFGASEFIFFGVGYV